VCKQNPIGGSQVLNKYLKYRKGRPMDDPPRHCRIMTALSKTIELQKKIDGLYPEVEKSALNVTVAFEKKQNYQ